jgi:hypothetical protein
MKTLIEKSIKITGVPKLNAKTIFNLNQISTLSEDATEEQKRGVREKELENKRIINDRSFISLTEIKGRRLVIEFESEEDGVTIKDKVLLYIPRTESEEEIKAFIVSEIAKIL